MRRRAIFFDEGTCRFIRSKERKRLAGLARKKGSGLMGLARQFAALCTGFWLIDIIENNTRGLH